VKNHNDDTYQESYVGHKLFAKESKAVSVGRLAESKYDCKLQNALQKDTFMNCECADVRDRN
jgi:hypothetical protein